MMKIFKRNFILILFIILFSAPLCFADATDSESLSAIENSLFGFDYKNEKEITRIERIENHIYGNKKSGEIKNRLKNIQSDTGITYEKPKPKVTVSQQQENQNTKLKQEKEEAKQVREIKESPEVDYPIVDKMEEEIFHTTYKKDNIYTRLDRLEERVFKKKNTGDLYDRVDKLAAVIAPVKSKQRASQSYTAQDLDEYYYSNGFEQVNNQTVPFQIAALEQEILKTQYTQEPNSKRLTRLEQKLFNRTFSTDTDTTRVQRLTVAYDAKKSSYKYENNRKAQNAATMSQIGGILLMILAILL